MVNTFIFIKSGIILSYHKDSIYTCLLRQVERFYYFPLIIISFEQSVGINKVACMRPSSDKVTAHYHPADFEVPKLPDGQVYLAVALGLESHIQGSLVARLRGYPGEAKGAIDAALASDPNNAWALAALGGWNIAIVHGGGETLAELFYGATLKKGLDAFAAALRASPDNIAVRYQYALSLSTFDAVRFRSEIEGAFTHVVNEPADTAYGRLLQKRAGDLLELLKNGDSAAYTARVRKYQGFP